MTAATAKVLPRAAHVGAGNARAIWQDKRRGADLPTGMDPTVRAEILETRPGLGAVLRWVGVGVAVAWVVGVLGAVWSVDRSAEVVLGGVAGVVVALTMLVRRYRWPWWLAGPTVAIAANCVAWLYAGERILWTFGAEMALAVLVGVGTLVAFSWATPGPWRQNLGLNSGDKVTPDLVQRAIAATKSQPGSTRRDELAAMVRLVTPITERADGGWETTVRLPEGVTADEVVKAEATVASTLHVSSALLDVRQAGEKDMVRLIRWGVDPTDIPSARSAFGLDPHPTSIHDAFRLGQDSLGADVMFRITDGPLLDAGARGSGKTVAECRILAHALCDPTVDVYVADGKMIDTLPVRDVCTVWAGRDIADLVGALEAAHARMLANQDLLLKLGEGEITREIAEAHGLREIVVVVDELAWYMGGSRWSKVQRGQVEDLLSVLLEYGRAFGVHMVLCTQTPTADVVTARIQAQLVQRLAFATVDATVSNLILGGKSASLGWRTDEIADRPGVGILRHGGKYQRLRADNYDKANDLRRLAAYASGLREGLGVLPARGEVPEVIAACLAVFAELDADRVRSAVLADRLGYVDQTALADALRPFDIGPAVRRFPDGQARGYLLTQFSGWQAPVPAPVAVPVPGPSQGRTNVIQLRPRYASGTPVGTPQEEQL